jgi:ABC-type branched-subunit amino acid transport system ATPase component
MRAVTAEIPKSSGTVFFDGEDITRLETDAIIRLGIGYLRQDHNIFPGLSIQENLDLAASGSDTETRRQRSSILKVFPALQEKQGVRAGLLSGGERQALALAMVLVRPIRLLLLDEPVAGLSQKNAAQLLEGVSELQRKVGFAILMAEHRLKLIRPHVSRVIVMVRGGITEDTTETAILEDRERLERHYLL